jgi:acetyl-CoA synthetase
MGATDYVLKDRLAQLPFAVRQALAPHAVILVRDLPRTRNAKIMRRVIRAVYLGKDPGDISSLENPAAVEEIRRAMG